MHRKQFEKNENMNKEKVSRRTQLAQNHKLLEIVHERRMLLRIKSDVGK